jgi:hypothetical protein
MATVETEDILQQKIRKVRDFYARILEQAKQKYARYAEFISELQQSVKIVHDGREYWIPVRVPYMTVAGRIAEAMDEHLAQQKKMSYKTVCEKTDDGEVLIKAIVESEIRGYSEGIVKLGKKISRSGQDYSYEDAETSALGRALAKLGYGLVGHNIASYEEVMMKGVAVMDDSGSDKPDNGKTQTTQTTGTRERMQRKKELMERGMSEEEAEAALSEPTRPETTEDTKTTEMESTGKNGSVLELKRARSKAQAVLAFKKAMEEKGISDEKKMELLAKVTRDPKDFNVFIEAGREAGIDVVLVD